MGFYSSCLTCQKIIWEGRERRACVFKVYACIVYRRGCLIRNCDRALQPNGVRRWQFSASWVGHSAVLTVSLLSNKNVWNKVIARQISIPLDLFKDGKTKLMNVSFSRHPVCRDFCALLESHDSCCFGSCRSVAIQSLKDYLWNSACWNY